MKSTEVHPDWNRVLWNRLQNEPYDFEFFQAVRLLGLISPDIPAVGYAKSPRLETLRFRANLSLSFPPSAIINFEAEEKPPDEAPSGASIMEVSFMGLYGPSGVLPVHYTEQLIELVRAGKGSQPNALRAWYDLFNHRLISLFYRSWEKYRFALQYERNQMQSIYSLRRKRRSNEEEVSLNSVEVLYSLTGLGGDSLRNRLVVRAEPAKSENANASDQPQKAYYARIRDDALFFFGGMFVQRPRNAGNLQSLVSIYFGIPATILQFQGQWLSLGIDSQTQLGSANCGLGIDALAGDRVWDVQSKIRIQLGPLDRKTFGELMPDKTPGERSKMLFLVIQLVRFYIGPELDFDIQLILRAPDVPLCQMGGDTSIAPRLGWNTWALNATAIEDASDVVLSAEEVYQL